MTSREDALGFLRDRRVIVFGAGYVGGAVVRTALTNGARVVALTRNPAKADGLRDHGATVVVADLADAGWHDYIAAEEGDLVLNCVSSGGGGTAGYERSYVGGMQSVLGWHRKSSAKIGSSGHLIYTGSTSVYPSSGGERVDESAPTDTENALAGILLQAETLVGAWAGPHSVLRLAGIYGPDRHYLLNQLQDSSGDGQVAGVASTHLNLIHRDDIVAAIFAAWSRPDSTAGQVFNLADDGAAPKGEVVAWLAARLGRSMPEFTGQPAGGRRRTTPDRIIANDRFKAATGWRPLYPTFREGYAAILGA